MNDDNKSEWETYSFFERFVHDDEFRQLLDVMYKVPDNSDSDKDNECHDKLDPSSSFNF